MKYRYRTDEEMKDSGVEWLGKIPKEWEIKRNKDLFKIDKNIVGENSSKYKVLSLTMKGVIERDLSENAGKIPATFDGYQIVNRDSLLLCLFDMDVTPRISGYVSQEGIVSPAYTNLNKKYEYISNKFYSYWFFKLDSEKILLSYSKSLRNTLTNENFMSLNIISNELEEQVKIANFLDEKTSQFDSIISKKEALIEKLEEAKKSLISEVVTGKVKVVKTEEGYDIVPRKPEEMKDSGVEWLGLVPKEWELKRLKYLFKIKKDIARKLGYDVLSVTQSGIKIKDITKNEGQLSMDYSKYQLVNKNDFVMNHMDLLTGFVDCSKFNGVTSPDYRVFKLINSCNSRKYYNYIFQSCYYNKIFYGLAQGVSGMGRLRLQTDKFLNFTLPLPTIEEQLIVSEILDNKIKNIDILKNKLKLNIQKLKEAKQSLITEAVTGKIEILD